MGLVYFNSNSRNSSGNVASPLFQPKEQFNPYNTYQDSGAGGNNNLYYGRLYNWRTGVGNYGWTNNSGTVVLSSINSSGVESVIASTALTTILSSSVTNPCFHYNSIDQCTYFLLGDGNNLLRLCKMNDTTGVISAIGASFPPATLANWPISNSADPKDAQIYIDTGSGHLKVICNGVFHLINKSTGAIVSQDTSITIGSFNTTRLAYFTSDGVIGAAFPSTSLSSLPRLVHATSGHIKQRDVPSAFLGDMNNRTLVGTIDSDKIVISKYPNSGANTSAPIVILRSDYDKYLQSIYDYYTSA